MAGLNPNRFASQSAWKPPTMTSQGAKYVSQPTAAQRARFSSPAYQGYGGKYAAGQMKPANDWSGMTGASGWSQNATPAMAQAVSGNAMDASTGIQPNAPYTQADIAAAESGLRNAQLAMPTMPGTNHGATSALGSILNSATGALGNLAATNFAPDANAALSQYDFGGQQAQANALQGWQGMNANQLTRDMNFNRQKQNWLLRFINQQANSPEYFV